MGIEFELGPERRGALPPGGTDFLDDLAATLEPTAVESVLLFGSVITGEATAVSDIDLLVVLDNGVSAAEKDRVRNRCETLATRHLDAGTGDRNALERAVDRATGMFQSGFVATVDDVENGRFHAIFETSRLAYPLAPWRTVLATTFDSAVPIYGRSVSPDWNRLDRPTDRSCRELTRSAAMAFILATAQLPYALVSSRAVQYAMEAHKWTLYNCAFHRTGEPHSLDEAMELTPDVWGLNGRLRSLRDRPRFDVEYLLAVPLSVTLVHLLAIRSCRQAERRHGLS